MQNSSIVINSVEAPLLANSFPFNAVLSNSDDVFLFA